MIKEKQLGPLVLPVALMLSGIFLFVVLFGAGALLFLSNLSCK